MGLSNGLVWYGLLWFGQNYEAACRLREVICGFRGVIWVDGFKIRWVCRTDGWVGQVGGYVRWLGSSGGSRNRLGRLVWYGLVEILKLNSRP